MRVGRANLPIAACVALGVVVVGGAALAKEPTSSEPAGSPAPEELACGSNPIAALTIDPGPDPTAFADPGEAARAFAAEHEIAHDARSARSTYYAEDGSRSSTATDRSVTRFAAPGETRRIVLEVVTERFRRDWVTVGARACGHYVDMDETETLPPGAAPDLPEGG